MSNITQEKFTCRESVGDDVVEHNVLKGYLIALAIEGMMLALVPLICLWYFH